jgi:hypothetical protein
VSAQDPRMAVGVPAPMSKEMARKADRRLTQPVEACPHCTSPALIPAESCYLCRTCGYSLCG